MPHLTIAADDLTHPAVHALLGAHLQSMHALSPPTSVHALHIDKLRAPDIAFFTAWDGDLLLGCGALKELNPTHGELKSMRTVATHLRRGTGRALLNHLLALARSRGYTQVSLETGTAAAFTPAHKLYESAGFRRCGPFADYVEDPNSTFMTLRLADAPSR